MTDATEARLHQIIALSQRHDTYASAMIRDLVERILSDEQASVFDKDDWQMISIAVQRAPMFTKEYRDRQERIVAWAEAHREALRSVCSVCGVAWGSCTCAFSRAVPR